MDRLFSFKVPADISNYPQYHAVYRQLYVKALVIIGMPVSAFFCLYNIYQSRMVMGGIVLVMFLALCFFVYDFKMKPEGRTTGFFQELAIRVFLIFFIMFLLYDAGIDQSISKTPWFLIFSVLIFFSINMREALAWSACIAAILAYFFFVSDLRANPSDIFQLKTRLLLIYGMLASIAVVTSGVMQSALQNLFNNQKELQETNQRLLDENEERKKAEDALRRSEEKFRSFVESTSDWIWEVNADGVYTYSSPQVEGILGYRPEEIVGKTPFDIMQPEEADRAAGIFQTAVKQSAPIVSLDNECVHKDGRIITLETSGVPVLDKAGNVAYFRGIDRDISDRRKTKEALQASNERFLTVLNSIDATIYVSDMDTYEILFTNKNMIETFGRDTTGEVCYDVFRKLSEPCEHCPIDQLLDENGTPAGVCVWQSENPVVKKWYISYDRAIEWTDGRLVKLQIAADITHLKKIEKQFK